MVRESKMKSVTQIREHLIELAENVESSSDVRKLTTLVRAGLFDPNKLTMLKRALNKENIKMTKAERDALLELLDRLLNVVMANQGTFMKVKQSISEATKDEFAKAIKTNAIKGSATNDIDITQIPPLIILKRKAIRVFPDGQKVALYYADRIDKYISVPFQSIGISEEVEQIDEISAELASKAYARAHMKSRSSDDDDTNIDNIKKSMAYAKTANSLMNKIRDREASGKFEKGTSNVAVELGKRTLSKQQKIVSKNNAKRQEIASKRKEIRDKNTTGSLKGDYDYIKGKTGSKASAAGGALGVALGQNIFGNRSKVKAKNLTKMTKLPMKMSPKTPAKVMRESKFRDRLNELREARQYGAADAALDAASFIPGPAGMAASLGSAGMSLSRGDYLGAALDVAGAIPLVGYAAKAAKMAKVAKAAGKVGKVEKAADLAGKISKGGKITDPARLARRTAIAKGLKAGGKGGKLGKFAKIAGIGALGAAALGGGNGGSGGSNSGKDGSSGSTAVPAFKGTSIKGTDSFSNRASSNSAEAERMQRMQTAVNRSMTGRSTAVSEETELNENPALLALARLAPTVARAGGAAAARGGAAATTRGGLARAFGSKAGRRRLAGAALDAMSGGGSDGDAGGGGGSSSKSNKVGSTIHDEPFKGTTIQGADSFTKKGSSGSAEMARMQKMQTAVNRSMTGRSTAVSEDTINKLKVIAETRQPSAVEFADGSSLDVSRIMATKLVETYDAMNKDNKKLFLEMINKDKASFIKLFKFASKQ